MNSLADNAIMLQVKAGNPDKMSLLFERHNKALYAFLFHMTYRKEASEDMVQNVFYRMLKYSNTFKGDSEFVYWMFHIARNVLNEYIRKNKNYAQQYDLADLVERTGSGSTVEELYEKKEAKAKLYEAISRLSVEQREVIALSRFQELKHQEIGQILGITEGAVKVRVHRAMQELKNIFFKINN